jgi:sugar (pentulose or hexulose) kinase
MKTFLGIDFGTSGCRAIVIDLEENIHLETAITFSKSFSSNWIKIWKQSLFELLAKVPVDLKKSIQAIAINGTSSTVLLCDDRGNPITEPILYHDGRGKDVQTKLSQFVPPNHLTLSASSSLAKLIWWSEQSYFANSKMKCISWKAWHRKAYQLKSDVYNNKSGQTNELLSS